MDSAAVFFNGVSVKGKLVDQYVLQIEGKTFAEILPPALKSYVKQHIGDGEKELNRFHHFTRSLVSMVVLLAYVVEIKQCGEVPLILSVARGSIQFTMNEKLAIEGKIDIEENTLFYELAIALVGGDFSGEERRSGEYSFLVSDFGWSIFLDVMGTKDPADARPELLHLQKGVPTVLETGQRKLRIKDANHTWHWDPESVSRRVVIDRGSTYLPRSVTTVRRRTEYYSTRNRELFLSVQFDIDESQVGPRNDSYTRFQLHSSFRFMHRALWTGVMVTSPCPHDFPAAGEKDLGLGVVTVSGLGEGKGFHQQVPERICVALVQEDRDARWLCILPGSQSQPLLRGPDCCIDCALKEAAQLSRRVLIVL
jgi:hypothetical protein